MQSFASPATAAEKLLQELERLAPSGCRPLSPEALARIKQDPDAYEAAVNHFAADGRIDKALTLAVRLASYWLANGRLAEGRERLGALLAADGGVPPTLRAHALERTGTFAFEQGATEEATALFQQSLAISREAGDAEAEATALGSLARCALMEGALHTARERARACERIHRARGDEAALDFPLHILAYADYIAGDDDRAREGFEETLALNRRLGNRRAVARELTNLGSVETRAGNIDRADALCREALELGVELENTHLVTYCVINLAGVASAQGDHLHAARLLGAAEAMLEAAEMVLNPGTAIEYERHVERTRTALGAEDYELAILSGHGLHRDAAVELALR